MVYCTIFKAKVPLYLVAEISTKKEKTYNYCIKYLNAGRSALIFPTKKAKNQIYIIYFSCFYYTSPQIKGKNMLEN